MPGMNLFLSAVLGVVSKSAGRERLMYGLRSLAWFVATIFGLGWLMRFGHR